AQSGVRIFGDASGSWVRTRPIWNEHAYHVTNVGDDGSIPAHEQANWTVPGLDNFRQNAQPGGEFSAPDAIVSLAPFCGTPYGLEAVVTNIGEAALPESVFVVFYAGDPPNGISLGTKSTTHPLYPAQSEELVLPLPDADPAIVNGTKHV